MLRVLVTVNASSGYSGIICQQDGSCENKAKNPSRLIFAQYKIERRERVSTWDGTVRGQRKKRLQARDKRLEEEEEKKKEQDRQFAEIVQQEKQQRVERAKLLQFNEKEPVKQINSRLLLNQVLKERDLQVKYKNEKMAENARSNPRLAKVDDIFGEQSNRIDVFETYQKHQIDCATAQKAQWHEKLATQKREKAFNLETTKNAIKEDQEHFKQEQLKRMLNKKTSQQNFLENLEQIKREKISKREEEVFLEKKLEKEAAEWKEKKDGIMEKKRIIEKERFENSLRLRNENAMRQFAFNKQVERNYEEIAEREKAKAEYKLKLQEDEKLKKKILFLKEIKEHRLNKISQKEEARQKESEHAKNLHLHFVDEARDVETEKQNKSRHNKEKALELQTFHKHQMNEMLRRRKEYVEERSQYCIDMHNNEVLDKANLESYINSLKNEPWCQEGVKKFIHNEMLLLKHDKNHFGNTQLCVSQTYERLGFGDPKGKD
ncbi:hypothetical protein ROZALSC1DRAFT_26599 [Rozella allomycis CSF55]|uniref:Trichohyalin-plectin-homology domain-containing protein n=1 Tax=Rozella allomycis (strain CSF55) TaxID=988480 RepID=A0A075ATV5_ROZAC|nr:hypothetical protein O9G_004173 [Rozella allomycis CSF55]RKP22015.1 hypothetical protein ROZALSC1DRAFT_26599 [Rozella allomycis CSF55]|eukprot:EPZ31982.1 hypothetical protein O9G_004173 [Rozella allomycis CSF55]